jgi:hypothetical protein
MNAEHLAATIPLWVTLIGFAAPLLTLAGSAVGYVVKQYLDAADKRRNRFFELMKYIDTDGDIATKVAAVYELRRYPEHREFVIRFCDTQKRNIGGSGAAVQSLKDEMQFTRDAMAAIPDRKRSAPDSLGPPDDGGCDEDGALKFLASLS